MRVLLLILARGGLSDSVDVASARARLLANEIGGG